VAALAVVLVGTNSIQQAALRGLNRLVDAARVSGRPSPVDSSWSLPGAFILVGLQGLVDHPVNIEGVTAGDGVGFRNSIIGSMCARQYPS
jgi:hypothetical protein